MQFTEDQSQALLVLTAAPRTADYEESTMLGVPARGDVAGAPRN